MIAANQLLGSLGAPARGPRVASVLSDLGFESRLVPLNRKDKRISSNEPFGFYVVFKNSHGLDLYFSYAEELPPEFRKGYAEGEPVLECVFFYADPKAYAGDLPGGLTMSDHRDVVRRKLGEPTEVLGLNDNWSKDSDNIGMSYAENLSIEHIQFSLKRYYRKEQSRVAIALSPVSAIASPADGMGTVYFRDLPELRI